MPRLLLTLCLFSVLVYSQPGAPAPCFPAPSLTPWSPTSTAAR